MSLPCRFAAGVLLVIVAAAPAWSQSPVTTPGQAPVTTAGPGRIICASASSCRLGIGTPAELTYQIDASALPDPDKTRLARECTDSGTPCVVTVEGAEGEDPLQVKAAKITWYN